MWWHKPSQRVSVVKKWISTVKNRILRDKLDYGSCLIIFWRRDFIVFRLLCVLSLAFVCFETKLEVLRAVVDANFLNCQIFVMKGQMFAEGFDV
jgi:hypothetical protein